MRRLRATSAALLAAALAFSTHAAAQVDVAIDEPADERPRLALMGTIPLYWGEAGDFGELLDSSNHAHWARAVVERDFALAPLDFLTAEALARYDYLLLPQPRALAGEENVALDAWVRDGGRVLIFADPMMTGESRFALGDRRRPNDVALLSPILAHWGLELRYDNAQDVDLHIADGEDGTSIPVNLPGSLKQVSGEECESARADGLIARCAIGAGHAVIVADAAMIDFDGPHDGAEAALEALLADAFGEIGENAGNGAP